VKEAANLFLPEAEAILPKVFDLNTYFLDLWKNVYKLRSHLVCITLQLLST